ncbi:MAG TPA: malto-oligosyltrehalose synthase [Kofleriaceae bacterium]|nr:malto-oligosyltrehalose synthase [Kofleriaceae bacterium]
MLRGRSLLLVVAAALAVAPGPVHAGARATQRKAQRHDKVTRPARTRATRPALRGAALARRPQRHPLSTYRLQLTPSFTFARAAETLPYLARLGIRTVYLSPVLQARSGSQHGYDVADTSRVNAELGGAKGFRSLVKKAGRLGLDLVIDVVPNHMGVGPENKAWDDVLAHGQASRFARYFDIDWGPTGRRKLVVPTLGDTPEKVAARGELSLSFEEKTGSFRVRYFDKSFPVDPRTEKLILGAGAAKTPAAIRAAIAAYAGPAAAPRWRTLLGRQPYRLTYWKTGNSRVNYRRFFTINELAALRQEDPAVFEATHRKTLDLVRIGREEGVTVNLRIDHPDGMADPGGMLSALRAKLTEANPDSTIWVESILAKEQSLPEAWPVAGTTGYDFMNELGRAPIDEAGFRRIDDWYRKEILRKPGSSFHGAVAAGKRQMLRSELAPDVRFLVERLGRLDVDGVSKRDLRDAVIDAITAMPVYRTYLTGAAGPGVVDAERLDAALGALPSRNPGHGRALTLVRRLLTTPAAGTAQRRADRTAFVTRFQQLSAATMAKGLEDTAHYRDYALAALNEVGGSPEELTGASIEEFHQAAGRRDARAMLAGTTHDTKRSADARTRLAVLTWAPQRWIDRVGQWRAANAPTRGAVDANTEYLAYQTLVALWPRRAGMPDDAELGALETRVEEYMIKAAREGKRKTRWSKPDAAFEADLRAFVKSMFRPDAVRGRRAARPFLRDVARFVAELDRGAIGASLSRTVVHYSAPGTADTYQGDELWSFVAVDPDNRRPVDYDRRAELLADVEKFDHTADRPAFARQLARNPKDDRLKLHVVRRSLQARNADPELFGEGAYTPVRAQGGAPVLAFARTHGGRVALTVAPQGPGGKRAVLDVPQALRGARLTNQLTGASITLRGATVHVADLLGDMPAALLVGDAP